MTPECAQTQNMVMWISTDNAIGSTLELSDYSGNNHADIIDDGWDIFDDTKYYIDNYYDISLKLPYIAYVLFY